MTALFYWIEHALYIDGMTDDSRDWLADQPTRDNPLPEDLSHAELAAGARLGPYRVVGKLGQGGMGVVYAAHDERLDRPVALKTLRADLTTADRRLWREARVAAAINHPNICQLYDVREDGGHIYLVMELLEGESLASAIRRGPMEL